MTPLDLAVLTYDRVQALAVPPIVPTTPACRCDQPSLYKPLPLPFQSAAVGRPSLY